MASATPVRTGRQLSPTLRSSATLKSILRTNTTLKRSRSDDDDEIPSSPTKKRRVVFDMDLNTVQAVSSRSLEQTKKEVRKALMDHVRGEEEGYDTLKDIFANDRHGNADSAEDEDAIKPEELVVYLVALTTCVPLIDKSCSGLVHIITQMKWLGRDDAFVKAYVQFLAALVSAHGSYLGHVMSMFVDKFRETSSSSWTIPGFPPVDRQKMKDRLHSGLGYLLDLFPAARSIIRNVTSRDFPYSDESAKIHVTYIRHLLRLREYAKDLGPDIMELITDRLVKIDVKMQLDLDDLDDETSAAVAFQLKTTEVSGLEDDADTDESDAESLASDDTDYDEQAAQVKSITENVQKMDSALDILFELYTPIFSDPSSPEAMSCFEDLLAEFTNIILPTIRSRQVQFLIFHFSQRSQALTDMFVGTLFNIAFQTNTPMVLRQAAVAYLASYAARGAHVTPETVRSIVDVLVQHIELYRVRHEASCRGPSLPRFTLYYALTQALLYVFCFRWKDLVIATPDIVDPDDEVSYFGKDLDWLKGLKETLREQIWSKFNPLKVCNPAIVGEFAKLAGHLRFMYVHDKLQSNRRVHLSQFVSGAYGTGDALRDTGYDPHDESWLQLDPYFPFDPYQLPHSKRWLEDDYNPWKPIPGLNGQDEDEDSDDDADVDDGDVEEEDTATDDEKLDD